MSNRNTERVLQIELEKYHDDVQSNGGFLREFQHRIQMDYEKNPSKYVAAFPSILNKAAAKLWSTKPDPGSQLNLFSIGGIRIDDRLSFPDDTVPGGYRQVLQKYATVFHLYEDWTITDEMAQSVQRRSDQKKLAYEVALERAHGRLTARLIDLADEKEEEALTS